MSDPRDPRCRTLPGGVVTFLMTDIVGSTSLFRRLGEQRYAEVLATHQGLIRDALVAHDGAEVGTEGDSLLAAFGSPDDAAAAAVSAQQALLAHRWERDVALRVRMGIHLGHATPSPEREYVSFAIHQAARVTDAAQGGQILTTSAVTEAATGACGHTFTPLGSYWLKDFPEPVPLFAVTAGTTATEPAAPRAPRADLSNLPALRGHLVGRDTELRELSAMLEAPVLLTITGPGGVGKTRLALELAARQAAAGAEAWVVELAGLTRTDGDGSDNTRVAVVTAIARALGSEATEVNELARQLGSSSMLLVLDNAEHLVDAVAEVVAVLLAGCPQLRLLVTSREPLAVGDEQICRLAPLATPGAEESPEAIDNSPAVALFAARAKAADRDFALTPTNRAHVVELCRMLDGLPLALELAAARINVLPPQALLERVRAVGDLPGLTGRGRPNRHATLHGVLDWSLSICSDVEVAVLRRMAVFAGPVDLDAVVAVTGGELFAPEVVVDALAGLVDKSLVVLRRGETASYDLLVTIRQAAFSRLLAADERDEALWRHARWLLDRCRVAAPGGLERDTPAIRALAVEIEVVLERGAVGEVPRDVYLDLVLTIRDHFFTRAQHLGVRHALLLAEQDIAPAYKAQCLNAAAKSMLEIRQPGFAATTGRAIEIARECGETEALARGLLAIAEMDLLSGPHLSDDGVAALRESMALMSEMADASPRAELHLLVARGWIALHDQDFPTATRWYTECLEVSRAHGSKFLEATSHFNLAEAAELAGDLWRSVEEYGLAAETSLALDGFVSAADALLSATRLLITVEDTEAALEYAADAVLAARRSRSEELLRAALLAQAEAATAHGDEHLAQRARREADALETVASSVPAHAV